MKVEMIHLQMVRDNVVEYNPVQTITVPEMAADWIRPIIGNLCREQIIVCGMDTKMNPTFIETIAIGTVCECRASMAEIFKTAILTNAYGVIVFHNHPSGDCTPSKMDDEVTDSICKSANLLGIRFLDHIIVGDENNYYSYMENRAKKVLSTEEKEMI